MTDSKEHRGWRGRLLGGGRTRVDYGATSQSTGDDSRAWARPGELADLSSLPPDLAQELVSVAAAIDEADQARHRGDRAQAERLLRGAVESVVAPYRQLAEERLGVLLSEDGKVEEAVALWLRAAEGPGPELRQAVGVYLGSVPFSDAGFLVKASPATLLDLLPEAWGPGRLGAAVYGASAYRHRDAPAAVRRQLLALDAARYGDPELAARFEAVPVADERFSSWSVEWASGTQLGGCRWSVAGHRRGVSAIAVGTARVAGRPVVVTGGDDGTVCSWDLATGDPVGEPMADHTGPVYSVATAELEGRAVAVSAGTDMVVRIWDLSTRRLLHPPLAGHTDWVTAVATATLRGRPVAVTCGRDQTVRVWDLATGLPVGKPMGEPTDTDGPLAALATTMLGRQTVAVTIDLGGTVRLWDLLKGRQLRPPLATEPGATALATVVVDGRLTVAVGGSNGLTTLWDLTTGAQVGRSLASSTRWPQTVAAAQTGAGPVVVTSDHKGMVRLWDPGTGAQIGQAFAGPLGGTRALAASVLDGRPVVLIGTGDGRIRRWDPTTDARPVGRPLSGHGDKVTAAMTVEVDGTTLVVSSSLDETARLWNLADGTEAGTPFTGHGDSVRGMATAVVDGRPVMVTIAGDTATRLWDPATGSQLGDPLTHDTDVDAVATTTLNGRPVAVTGSADGLVRVWNLTTREDIHGPMAGHVTGVTSVAATVLDDRPVAVTADEDTVRLWDLDSGAQIGLPIAAPPRDREPDGGHDTQDSAESPEPQEPPCIETVATALVDGRPVAVVSSDDGVVHIWDLATRALIGQPLRVAADDGLTAMITAQVAGRAALVAGGGDGTVRIWDLATRARIGADLVLPLPVGALAQAPAGRLVVGFGWEVAVFRPAQSADAPDAALEVSHELTYEP